MGRKIVLLGSTGSIGTQTLDVVRSNPDELKVIALAAGRNVDLMEKQAREFKPLKIAMFDQGAAKELESRISDLGITVLSGMEGLLELVRYCSYGCSRNDRNQTYYRSNKCRQGYSTCQ